MKEIFVCFKDYDCEGCSEPLLSFTKEIDAKKWKEKNFFYGTYVNIEVYNNYEEFEDEDNHF